MKCGGNIIRAYLQCWNKTATQKYWIVSVTGRSLSPSENGYTLDSGTFKSYFRCLSNGIEPSLQDAAIERILQRDDKRQEEKRSQRIEANVSDNTTRWLHFMQWDETFRGKDLLVRSYSCAGH